MKPPYFGGRVIYYEGMPPAALHYDIHSSYPRELTMTKDLTLFDDVQVPVVVRIAGKDRRATLIRQEPSGRFLVRLRDGCDLYRPDDTTSVTVYRSRGQDE